jgi:hypothetical protein
MIGLVVIKYIIELGGIAVLNEIVLCVFQLLLAPDYRLVEMPLRIAISHRQDVAQQKNDKVLMSKIAQ